MRWRRLSPGRKTKPTRSNSSSTPIWLVGVFALIPGLRILGILGLYGLYLFWLGLPVLMKAPDDKSVPYAAAVVVCGIVVSLVIGVIVSVIA